MAPARTLMCKLQPVLNAVILAAGLSVFGAPALAQSQAPERELTVDELSVVKLTVKAVPDARSARTLGAQREGTGVSRYLEHLQERSPLRQG